MSRRSLTGFVGVVILAGAFGTEAARAGYVTPDSMGTPILASEPYETVPANGLVTNQYQNLGLLFPTHGEDAYGQFYTTAVIRLNNQDVFSSASHVITTNGANNIIEYDTAIIADLVRPGTTTPETADSVTVTFASAGPGLAQLQAFGENGQLLKTVTAQIGSVLDVPVELDIAGIQSISALVYQPVIDPPPGVVSVTGVQVFPGGVASIEWHNAPEPTSFVLGGLGMLALVGVVWRRRRMLVHKMPA